MDIQFVRVNKFISELKLTINYVLFFLSMNSLILFV